MVDALVLEAAKIALQLFFTNMRLAGKSEDEIEQIYQDEKKLFESNHPDNLPDV